MKKIIFSALFFLVATLVMAQTKDELKQIKASLKEADMYYESEEYGAALPFYEKALTLQTQKDPEASYKLARCYIEVNETSKALPYLLIAKDVVQNDLMNMYIGMGYHSNHDFDDALKYFNLYRSSLKKSQTEQIVEVDKYIKYCNTGKELMKHPIKVKLTNLGPQVNSPYPDYVPAISADETVLMFTSRRPNTVGGEKDATDGHYFEDIYVSVKSSDGKWTTATQLGSHEINTASHDACVGLSPDGQELFMYKVTGKDGGDLYMSTLSGTIWTTPKNLGKNINSDSWEPSATTNPDENVIIFSSDRKGGYGGTDLYISKKMANGQFGPALNMGPKINTIEDEDGPFIHADGKTFYFSSKGHLSMGGYDIFSCELDLSATSTETLVKSHPINIGYPINTADDDIFFVWSADNKRAYFSSAREGGIGEKDLYMLEKEDSKVSLVVFKGVIKSCDTHKPVSAKITVTDLATQKQVGVYSTNSSSGKYTVILPPGKNYALAVEAPGYLFYSKNIDVPHLDHYMEINDTICMNTLKVGTKIVLRNIFFDVDKATLRPESVNELERLVEIMKNNPTLEIEISGHTDSDASDEHNLKLSDARAHAVLDYVKNKGVSEKRMVWKGYGESQPMAPNDTKENKQLNRRTEIKILKN